MITLYQYPAVWGLASLSPFCIKVEAFLRVAGLPYKVEVIRNPGKGPKGKLPFITTGSEVIADSSVIIDTLTDKFALDGLRLESPQAQAQASALRAMIEESLYFILLYSRWVDPRGFAAIKREFLPLFPMGIGGLALSILRRRLRAQAFAQGIGRHDAGTVYGQGREQLRTLAFFLGDRRYFFEDKFSAIDATAFAFLVTILRQPFSTPLQEELNRHPNLLAYCSRLEIRCFPSGKNSSEEF